MISQLDEWLESEHCKKVALKIVLLVGSEFEDASSAMTCVIAALGSLAAASITTSSSTSEQRGQAIGRTVDVCSHALLDFMKMVLDKKGQASE